MGSPSQLHGPGLAQVRSHTLSSTGGQATAASPGSTICVASKHHADLRAALCRAPPAEEATMLPPPITGRRP